MPDFGKFNVKIREKSEDSLFNEYHDKVYPMEYPKFSVEDFCKDPDFVRWVLAPTDESNRFWQTFTVNYPDKAIDIRTAVGYVKAVTFSEINPSEQDLARVKQRIWTDLDRDHPVRDHPVRIVQWYQRPYWAAAAVVLLVSAVAMGWWTYRANAALTYTTAYGKIREIRLTDGSVVTLNANSSLRVADHLADNPVREVWLDGEAYFDIAKRQGAKFIVHTDETSVEVLGTEFNVNTRREQTNVVLHEGKVQLRTQNQSTLVMKPGDMATVRPNSRQIQLKRVEPERYDAWKESYLVLDGKTLPEIINSLEDTFGVTIEVANDQLSGKKLTGRLRTDVADDCIENLADILDASVVKTGDTYRYK